MQWNGSRVVVVPLAFAGALFTGILFAAARSAAPQVDQLIFTRGVEQAPMNRSVQLLRARLRTHDASTRADGRELQQEELPLPAGAKGTREFAGHLGLTVYRALKESRVPSGFALDFNDQSGLLRAFGFDARRGVEATFATKIEDERGGRREGEDGRGEKDERDEKDDAIDSACRRTIEGMVAALELEQKSADAPDDVSVDEPAPAPGDDDPPEFGFRWAYVRSGAEQLAQVTLVLDNSSLGRATLRRGDLILTINGQAVASPPRFGRAIAGLRAGAPLALEVRRGAETIALQGKVERGGEIVPAWEQRQVGAKLPSFHATIGGAPVDVGGGATSAATIVCLFDPRQPDTLRDAAVLAWLRDHHAPEELAIAGIAVHADGARLTAAMDELACGWPAVADPDGRLAEATRTITLPALLVADRDGIVRFRPTGSGRLQHALRRVVAAKH